MCFVLSSPAASPGRRGEACGAWRRLLQESMNRWACPILPEGPTTPLGESSAGSFAFLNVRYEKSENGLPWVSYGVGKAKGPPASFGLSFLQQFFWVLAATLTL